MPVHLCQFPVPSPLRRPPCKAPHPCPLLPQNPVVPHKHSFRSRGEASSAWWGTEPALPLHQGLAWAPHGAHAACTLESTACVQGVTVWLCNLADLAGGGTARVGERKRKWDLCPWLSDEWHNTGQIVLNVPELYLPASAAAPSLQVFPPRWREASFRCCPPHPKTGPWQFLSSQV